MATIAIDLDSTLNNLLSEWLARYNAEYNDNVTSEHIVTWDTHKYVRCGVDVYKYFTPELFTALQPQTDSIRVTSEMSQRHTLVIVSAISRGTYDAKKNWCSLHFPHIKYFIGTHDKQFICADMLIDDAPHNLLAFPGKTICIDYAYNRHVNTNRARNWLEVQSIVGGMYGKK